ncbi:hypothetical protein IV203_019855 [Nitzschia inconspicua]|uniref:Ubiquitin-like protease family profile domain-containing protein n=1 Tax=Nitzschia inconspicua TaxID=303405 RepID=A0A9K3LZF6_9STRA|nr:hypothetical protein IV203_019855 [Nitzschia inconspicua]
MARSGLQKIFFVMIGLFLWTMTQLHPNQIVFDNRSPDIFHEVSVYDSLIKGGRRNNLVHRNSPPAKYLRPFQQFIANFCLFGNPKCEVLLANPDHIVEKAVYRSCPLQQNGFDCGLFAFGCVLHLLKGLDVSADIFNQQHISKLRESLHAVFTDTVIGTDVPNPRELLSSSFLSSFFPLQSENACHDDVFLRLLQDLPNNDNDIDAAPDVPDKAPPIELDVVPLHPRLGADPQPGRTRHRDNYFTTQFLEVPKEFRDMSKVDLAIDELGQTSHCQVTRHWIEALFLCFPYGLLLPGQIWQRKGYVAHYLQTGIVQSIPLRRTCPTQNKRPCTQKKGEGQIGRECVPRHRGEGRHASIEGCN